MSDFYSRKPVAKWRIVSYGILAAAGMAALGYFQHDHSLYFFAGIAGAFICGFGFFLSAVRASVKPVQVVPEQPARSREWVYWMFFGLLALNIALKLLGITHKK
jgi:hypothetical protein